MTIDPVLVRTVGGAFLDRAERQPEQTALTVYGGSAAEAHPSLSYAELARRAGRRAEELSARLAPGERVLLSLPTGTQYVELYLACLLAGLVAVPTPPSAGSTAAAGRVAAIVADCRPGLAFTTEADLAAVTGRLSALGFEDVPVEVPGEAGPGDAPAPEAWARRVTPDALAVLQYSSGATGSPKGVMLAHENVLANIVSLHDHAGLGLPGDSFGSWMPLHHDFGLFVQLSTALIYGAPTVLMSPTDFVRRPVEWFRLMDRYGTTVTCAPDFAFGLCLRLIRDEQLDGLDLSRVRYVASGSEPVHVPTYRAFAKRFVGIGLRPEVCVAGYGLAETVVYASSCPRGRALAVLVADPRQTESAEHPRLVATAAGSGKEIAGIGMPRAHEMRIVDPVTRRALPDGSIGELWLRGAAVGRGYWDQPELSREVFEARLAEETEDAAGWLRTGDLAAVVDGELYITGRLKELVIVRGKNLFPQDLEQEARRAHPALEGFVGAAFGVGTPDERVVLVHEVDPRLPADQLPAVATEVLRRLGDAFGVPVRNILLVRRGTVRRTTSGKIQRRAMRELFLAGGVTALHGELERDVRQLVSADAA